MQAQNWNNSLLVRSHHMVGRYLKKLDKHLQVLADEAGYEYQIKTAKIHDPLQLEAYENRVAVLVELFQGPIDSVLGKSPDTLQQDEVLQLKEDVEKMLDQPLALHETFVSSVVQALFNVACIYKQALESSPRPLLPDTTLLITAVGQIPLNIPEAIHCDIQNRVLSGAKNPDSSWFKRLKSIYSQLSSFQLPDSKMELALLVLSIVAFVLIAHEWEVPSIVSAIEALVYKATETVLSVFVTAWQSLQRILWGTAPVVLGLLWTPSPLPSKEQ